MISLPVDIVNYICEFAAGNDKAWYPFFSPKSHKLSWKVNPYCNKFIISSKKFLNQIREVNLTFYNSKSREEVERGCKMIIFNQSEIYKKKVYIEFDSDDDNSQTFMIRGLLNVFNHNIKPWDILYLNRTEYATIIFGWCPNILNGDSSRIMTIEYETY